MPMLPVCSVLPVEIHAPSFAANQVLMLGVASVKQILLILAERFVNNVE